MVKFICFQTKFNQSEKIQEDFSVKFQRYFKIWRKNGANHKRINPN